MQDTPTTWDDLLAMNRPWQGKLPIGRTPARADLDSIVAAARPLRSLSHPHGTVIVTATLDDAATLAAHLGPDIPVFHGQQITAPFAAMLAECLVDAAMVAPNDRRMADYLAAPWTAARGRAVHFHNHDPVVFHAVPDPHRTIAAWQAGAGHLFGSELHTVLYPATGGGR